MIAYRAGVTVGEAVAVMMDYARPLQPGREAGADFSN
jgi:hypothetical protein